MEKKKAILKIESFSHKDGTKLLSVADYGVRAMLKGLVELCEKKYGSYIKLEMSPPYKARTTGQSSQNNLIWKLITVIANETGNELEDVEIVVKERALKRGYPYRQNKLTGKELEYMLAACGFAIKGNLEIEVLNLFSCYLLWRKL